jgi:hypothetical protein
MFVLGMDGSNKKCQSYLYKEVAVDESKFESAVIAKLECAQKSMNNTQLSALENPKREYPKVSGTSCARRTIWNQSPSNFCLPLFVGASPATKQISFI